MNFIGHFNTITHHKILVLKYCFKCGLYKQGLLHDMSKYFPSEFFVGVKYFQGNRSPNDAERNAQGYSSAWLHHKGRNKHHFEYWIDYSNTPDKRLCGVKMPKKYVVEMFCDRIAASKIYRKDKYRDSDPLDYYNNSKSHIVMHDDSRELLEKLLIMLKNSGEKKTFDYIRRNVL